MAAESDLSLQSGTDDKMARKQIYQIWEECRRVRRLYWDEFQEGAVSEETRRLFQEVVMTYYDELRKYRENPKIRNLWQEAGPWEGSLDKLPSLASRVEAIETEQTGSRGGGTVKHKRPKRIPADVLYEVSRDLDDIAVQLDFGIQTEPPEAETDPI